MRVFLLSPPFVKNYMRNARCDFISLSSTQWFPILLGYLGAFLESKGCSVKLIDAVAYNLNFLEVEKIYDEYSADVLVVYPGDKSRDSDIEFSNYLLSKRKVKAIFVGPYFAIEPTYFLQKSEVCCGVLGEFEYPVWEFINTDDFLKIKSLIYKDSDGIHKNLLRHPLTTAELDAIPFVSDFFNRHLDFRYYRTPSEPYPFVDIMTGRGCKWGLCTFCLWPHTYGRGSNYSARSIENVMEEFMFIEKFLPQIRSVMIQDDTLTEERIVELCEEKLKRNIKIPFSCYVRPNIKFEVLLLMKKANCLNLHVGFESANDAVLKNIKKGISKECMNEFAYNARRAKLHIHGDFMIGLLGETKETTEELINWAISLKPFTAQFQIFIPFKGTPIFEQIQSSNRLSKEEMEYFSKKAYRKFYISWSFLFRLLRHPYYFLFKKMCIIYNAIASVFWRKLDIR